MDEKLKEIKRLWSSELSSSGFSSNIRHDDIGWLIQIVESQAKMIESLSRIEKDMEDDYNILTSRYVKAITALEQIVSLTLNPREYEPSLSSINHIAREGI